MGINELTPVQRVGEYWVKREDLFEVFGVCGGKARAAYQLIKKSLELGFRGIVTAGSRQSPQCEIVSFICEKLGIKCFLFMPRGCDTSVTKNIESNSFSTIIRQPVGYNNVICSHAKMYAEENSMYYVPFGMELGENVEITSLQVENIPKEVKRIVVPVGSGMSISSVLNGLTKFNRYDVEVLGVQVGKQAQKTIDRFYEPFLLPKVKFSLVDAGVDYHKTAENTRLGDIELDPIYEAKCIPFLQPGDLLWVVGHRK